MRSRDQAALAIGAIALATAVLVVGGALRWTQAVIALLVAAALAVQFSSRRSADRISPILALLGAAIGLTALQLVPFPPVVLHALDPTGMDLRKSGAVLAGTHPWPCLSLDAPGTVRALTFFITLFGVATLSLRLASSERGRYLLFSGVTLVCGVAAMVTGAHLLVNASSLYGLYEPVHAHPPILGPLLNPNHLGCLMAFGSALAIGMAFYEQQASQLRVLWTVIALGCALVAFGSESRGAALALGLGVVVTLSLLIGRRVGARHATSRQRKQGLLRDLPIIVVVAIGLALAVYASAGKVADQLENTTLSELNHPLSKFEAWKSSFKLLEESPWVGVGRGAIEPTLTRVHQASAYATFSHLENEYISAVVEWGVPGALVLGLLLGWCVITAIRRWRDDPLVAGALGAIAAVMFQSSVDFGIELLGLAVPVTAIAAATMVVPLRTSARLARTRLARAVLIAGLLATVAVLLLPLSRSLQEDHDALGDDSTTTVADYRDDIQRHPLDYFGFGKTAYRLVEHSDPRGVAFLNHALMLHPWHSGLHALAARMLASDHHPKQAAFEYASAMEGLLTPKELLTEIVTMLPKADDAAAAIPLDTDLETPILNTLKELNRQDVSVRWLERLARSDHGDLDVVDTWYELALELNDLDEAKRAATLRLNMAHTYASRLMLARVELAQKDYAPILADLADVESWHTRIDLQGDAWLIRCDALFAMSKLDETATCLHHLDGSGIMAMRRDEVTRRLQDLAARHASDLTAHAIQQADHLPVPPQVDLAHPPADSQEEPAISNPLSGSPLQPN